MGANLKLSRIMHVAANVEGHGDESVAFYRDFLGLEVASRPEVPGVNGWWFKMADAQVHLVDALDAGHGIDPTGSHFCFGVPDIAAAIEELEANNIPIIRATQGPDKVVQVWFCDPGGNTIELQQDRELT